MKPAQEVLLRRAWRCSSAAEKERIRRAGSAKIVCPEPFDGSIADLAARGRGREDGTVWTPVVEFRLLAVAGCARGIRAFVAEGVLLEVEVDVDEDVANEAAR